MIKLSFILNCLILIMIVINQSDQINQGDKLPLKNYQELDNKKFKFETISNNRIKKRQTSLLLESPFLQTNRFEFNAFDKKFIILLKKDTFLIQDNLNIELRYSSKPSEYLNDFLSANYYTGIVENEPDSHVTLYYETDSNSSQPIIFSQIHINNIIYNIEPLFNSSNLQELKYIIYKTEDVQTEVISEGVFNQTVCRPKYAENLEPFKRAKRQTSFDKKIKKKNKCNLAIVADYKFFKEIGNSDTKLTSSYMMNIISSVNNIFTKTVWNLEEAKIEDKLNFGFSIEKIIVHVEPSVTSYEHYNNKNSSTNSDRILELFGEEDWSSYCLAHLFTFQSFEHSVLGLAYVSSPLGYTLGGICSPSSRRMNRKHSVNTGLSSYKSASQKQGRLLQREAELVTAHELGHNWGSEHDPLKPECSPSSELGGNFLMYPYSNQGHEKNNFLFSPCSINSISEVIKTKSNCFQEESLSFCGNDRIEEGEECDAGLRGRQGIDKCCDFNCKLKPGAQCSDNNHYCCNQCRIAPAGYKCYSSPNYIECFEAHSYCTGTSKDCPSQPPKISGSNCNSFDSGKCNPTGQCLSLCQQRDVSFSQCKCSKSEEKCMICCRNVISNSSNECRPINHIFPDTYKTAMYLSNGRSCFDGLCENRVCKQKVKDYISRFWKVIQKVTVSGFVEFMKRNIVGSIIVISLLIWVPLSCCLHFCYDKRTRAEFKKYIQEKNLDFQNPRYSQLSAESFNPNSINEKSNRLELIRRSNLEEFED